MIRYHADGTSRWEYAYDDFHLDIKLKGRPATVVKPVCGWKYVWNAIKGLLGLDYETFVVERRYG